MFCLIHRVCILPCWATDEFFDFDCHQALSKGICDNDRLCEQQLFIHKTPRMSKRFSQQNTHVVCKTPVHSSAALSRSQCDLAMQINTLCQEHTMSSLSRTMCANGSCHDRGRKRIHLLRIASAALGAWAAAIGTSPVLHINRKISGHGHNIFRVSSCSHKGQNQYRLF